MFKVLSKLGKELNKENIVWAVGASILLHQYKLVNKPNDIDIFVDLKDIEKVDEILLGLGEKKDRKNDSTYSTRYFYEYVVEGIDIDVMAGLRINHNEGVFEYTFNESAVTEIREIEGENIPFTSLEDWYVMYQMIGGREKKVSLIEEYLLKNGVKYKGNLQKTLDMNVSTEVKERAKTNLGHLIF